MSNVMHVRHAMAAIQAGMCEVALVAYGSTQLSDGSRKVGGAPRTCACRAGSSSRPMASSVPSATRDGARSMHGASGTTSIATTTHRDLAEVAVAARKWAQLNPHAYRREDTSIDEVMASRLIADPLRQRDCCLVTDAGGAFILTTAERAARCAARRCTCWASPNPFASLHAVQHVRLARHQRGGDGGRGAGDGRRHAPGHRRGADLRPLHHRRDPVAGGTGLLRARRGRRLRGRRRLAPGGDFPINTSGGGLSYNHPGQFGMLLLLEAVHQLRKECGERQLPKPSWRWCTRPAWCFPAIPP